MMTATPLTIKTGNIVQVLVGNGLFDYLPVTNVVRKDGKVTVQIRSLKAEVVNENENIRWSIRS